MISLVGGRSSECSIMQEAIGVSSCPVMFLQRSYPSKAKPRAAATVAIRDIMILGEWSQNGPIQSTGTAGGSYPAEALEP